MGWLSCGRRCGEVPCSTFLASWTLARSGWKPVPHRTTGRVRLRRSGMTCMLIPPAYVKPYVKRQKNDAADAEAICEAVTRPNMRFVPVKSEEQQSVLVLHRSRDLLMRQRTMILNAIRAHFAEFGLITAQGPRRVADLVSRLRDEDILGLPELARSALLVLAGQLENLAAEVRNIERQLMA